MGMAEEKFDLTQLFQIGGLLYLEDHGYSWNYESLDVHMEDGSYFVFDSPGNYQISIATDMGYSKRRTVICDKDEFYSDTDKVFDDTFEFMSESFDDNPSEIRIHPSSCKLFWKQNDKIHREKGPAFQQFGSKYLEEEEWIVNDYYNGSMDWNYAHYWKGEIGFISCMGNDARYDQGPCYELYTCEGEPPQCKEKQKMQAFLQKNGGNNTSYLNKIQIDEIRQYMQSL